MDEIIKIELKSKVNSVIRTGMTVKAFLIFLMVLGTFIMAFNFMNSPTVLCILLVIGIVLISAFLKMLGSVFFRESLILTRQTITVLQEKPFRTKKYDFNTGDIIYLGFVEQQYTKNAMDNQVVDFTGLAAGEKELQYVIDEGNIMLQTADKLIKFGKNMPSWDVEEVLTQIEQVTGRKFESPESEASEETPE